ncbi:unnamed protein product [Victoria cruziana]
MPGSAHEETEKLEVQVISRLHLADLEIQFSRILCEAVPEPQKTFAYPPDF